MKEIKEALFAACEEYIAKRVATAKEAIADAKAAAANETKSSAGDKYETGRAMAQIAEAQAQGQLSEAGKLAEGLALVQKASSGEAVGMGSLVITPMARYFLAISVGKVSLDGVDYFVVSPGSPIGQALQGAKAGESVTFQGRSIQVREVH